MHDSGDFSSSLRTKFFEHWQHELRRTELGRPVLSPTFVAQQGRRLHIVDLRDVDDVLGELGYIPGCDWFPDEEDDAWANFFPLEEPIVWVCADGHRSAALAAAMEESGYPWVASLEGGIAAWRECGLSCSRDPAIVSRYRKLSPLPPWSGESRPCTLEEVQDHFGHPRSVRWVRLASFFLRWRLSCIDGRDFSAIVGAPGGDTGQLALLFGAYERLSGKVLSRAQINELFRRRLDAFGHFSLHSDVHADHRLHAALLDDARIEAYREALELPEEWEVFLEAPPQEIRPALLEYLIDPAYVGCGHLRLMIENSETYGIRRALVEDLLRVFFEHRWHRAPECEYDVLAGGHAEGAVVNVHVTEDLRAYSRVPLVCPSLEGQQVFVNHPDVANYLRGKLVDWLCTQGDLLEGWGTEGRNELLDAIEGLRGHQLQQTLSHLAAGLPLFDATVSRQGVVEVRESGRVPARR